MIRTVFYICAGAGLPLLALLAWFWPPGWILLALAALLTGVGMYDIACKHNVLTNYPVIGHMRYLLEFIRPELRQYFFESNTSGRPFNRTQRDVINSRADGLGDTAPFGTIRDLEAEGYDFAEHALAVKTVGPDAGRLLVGGPQCRQPYLSSRLNISAMSFGSLSANAVLAMNKGARLGGFAHNTGEGGLSPYHLEHGADVVWEIGTAYFGCRTPEGRFDSEEFRAKATGESIRMIELKLSQGAKPSHGGLLPGSKVNAEIARIRDIEPGEDCHSPPTHPEFDTPIGLLEFIQQLRELSGGKPVGFKLCIGRRTDFIAICLAMRETGITPDFITVDGAEGGTGAAPIEYADRLGTYINEAIVFVHGVLVGMNLRDDIRVFASGKVAMGFDMVTKIALGADACNAARPFMFTVGCIQALRCHTNTCPTGVATMDERRSKAIDVDRKALRVSQFHNATVKAFLDMTGALGCSHPSELTPAMIQHRPQFGPASTYAEIYPSPLPGELLLDDYAGPYRKDLDRASVKAF